jgi:putative transposase
MDWHHSPLHRLSDAGTYIVTAATHQKRLIFHTRKRLDLLHDTFFQFASKFSWEPQAWAFFPNHYHFIATSPDNPESLSRFLNELHSSTARAINAMDGVTGRTVWYQFWETRITTQGSYLARLRYVHENPVHHRVVPQAANYRWCSAAWFARTAGSALVRAVSAMKIDRVTIRDDFK